MSQKTVQTEEQQSQYGLRILNAIRQIIRAADLDSRQLAASHQITAPQLVSLMAIAEQERTTAVEVARRWQQIGQHQSFNFLFVFEGDAFERGFKGAGNRPPPDVIPNPPGVATLEDTGHKHSFRECVGLSLGRASVEFSYI